MNKVIPALLTVAVLVVGGIWLSRPQTVSPTTTAAGTVQAQTDEGSEETGTTDTTSEEGTETTEPTEETTDTSSEGTDSADTTTEEPPRRNHP